MASGPDTETIPELVVLRVPTEAVVIDGVAVPGIGSLGDFRAWTRSDDFPDRGRIGYLGGELWVDLGVERAYSHNQLKSKVSAVLLTIAEADGTGRFFNDGMRLSHPTGLLTEPDGMFVAYDTFRPGRVRRLAGRLGGVTEFEGTPDLVLEVVSDTSVEKDTEVLPELYARAGVPEFWRADARGELRFEVTRLTDAGYAPAAGAGGWWRSAAFGRSFRLRRAADPLGEPLFHLDVRADE